jgi:PAS domain S-box-containing protein
MNTGQKARSDPQRLELIVEGINAGVWDWNIIDNSEWWSARLYELLGYKEVEMEATQANFQYLLHPTDRLLVEQARQAHLDKGKLYRLDIRLHHKCGEYRWFEISGKAALNAEGKQIRMCGSVIDIHEKKLLQLELEKREFTLKEVCEMTISGGWEVDLASGRSFWSKQVYDICQMPYTYLPTLEDALSLYAPASVPIISKCVQQAIQSGCSWDEELQLITGKKQTIWVRAIGQPVFDEVGEVIGLRGVFQDINERKGAEQAFRESENRFRTLFNSTFQFTGLLSPDGTLLEANEPALLFAGIKSADVVGKKVWETHWFQSSQFTMEKVRESVGCAARGECIRFDIEVQGQDKHRSIIDFSIKPIENDTGQVIMLLPEGRDITEIKMAEALARRSEERLKLLISQSPIALAMLDKELNYLAASQRWVDYYRMQTTDFLGLNHYDLLPDIAANRRQTHDYCLEGNIERREEELVVRANGEVVWMKWEVKPWYDLEGNIGGLLLFTEDITQRKQAEIQLRKSEEKFHTMFDLSPVGMCLIDVESKQMVEFNQALYASLGYSLEEFSMVPFQKFIPPEYHALDQLQRDSLKQTGKYGPYEKELVHKDGHRICTLQNGILLIDERGRKQVWAFIQDISPLKKREQEIAQLNVELAALNQHKDRLFSIIAHDLRGSVNHIASLIDIMWEMTSQILSKEALHVLELAKDSSSKARTLLEELLLWSSIQFDMVSFTPQDLAMSSLVNQVLDSLQSLAEAKQLVFITHIPHGPTIHADEQMLKVVFRNLLSNAIKFSHPGGKITVVAEVKGAHIGFTIRDEGVGISKENLPKIFNKTEHLTTFGTKGEKGSGLGLELCREYVEKHSGTIGVESTLNQGSSFTFTLPINT